MMVLHPELANEPSIQSWCINTQIYPTRHGEANSNVIVGPTCSGFIL
jgi:hypothetical protein